MLRTNVGGLDKILRIVVGIALLAAGWFGPLGWWGLIGLVPLATGLLNTCPLYTILGLNTCPIGQRGT
jgi:hypothetical protein